MTEQQSSAARTMLVVEDDPDLWPMIERAVRRLDPGLGIEFAADYATAADRLRSDVRYALVLTDFLLADSVSGLHLRGLCREFQPKAAFAMMSAMPVRVPDLQAARFLRKPYTIAECERFLARVLAGEVGGGPSRGPVPAAGASDYSPAPG